MMQNKDSVHSGKQGFSGELTPLCKRVTFKDAFNDAAASDSIRSSQSEPAFSDGPESTSFRTQADVGRNFPENSNLQTIFEHHHRVPAVCHSMPATLVGFQEELARRDRVMEKTVTIATDGLPSHSVGPPEAAVKEPNQAMYHSQPIPVVRFLDSVDSGRRIPRNNKLQERRYQSFKTWSGALERHISNLRGRPREPEERDGSHITQEQMAMPKVDRYYESLKGPELDTLRSSEELVLPEEKWPFLLRFPISAFGMCLGVSSQAILYKNLATNSSTKFLHISPAINFVLWCISVALMSTLVLIYALKVVFYFEAVRREYYHPIRVNFFFAPWIACLFLAIGVPEAVATELPAPLWYVLMLPFLCLELKIYGQWMSGGQRRLSKVANPSNHLSVVGNFVGALLGASMGLEEGPVFFFAVGLAHYAVLFVTLYQRLPTNDTLPKELHPVFFLFVAAPSVASMAWAKITGDFGYVSRIAYFIALFLYGSLAVRINFFRGFRFSLAWWAYTFPMTGAAIATIRYSTQVKNIYTKSLAVFLSTVSTLTVLALLASTIIHAFVLHDLFPNDVVIAIAPKRVESIKFPDLPSMSSSDMEDERGQVNEGEDSEAEDNEAPVFDVPRR